MRVLLLDSRGRGRVPDGTIPAFSLRGLRVQSGQPLPQDRPNVGGRAKTAQCGQSRAHPRLGESSAALGGDGQVQSLLLWSSKFMFLSPLPFLRDEEAHDAALKAVDTFPDNADMHFQLANSHGKRVRFHQTVFITSMLSSIGLVRVSLLKGKESTSLPSKLPPSQRPFIIATLACFTIGS